MRKGLSQSLGRYATNLKEPVGYFLPKLDISSIPEYFEAVVNDDPSSTWAKWCAGDNQDRLGIGALAALHRGMFDLPSFENLPHPSLEKVGKKEHKITASPGKFAEIPPLERAVPPPTMYWVEFTCGVLTVVVMSFVTLGA